MAVVDGGRQCLRCDRHLLDLSTLTEAQVDDLRRRARQGRGVCAKLSLDSRGAPIFQKTAIRRLVQSAAGVVMSVSLAACGEPDGVTVTPLPPRTAEATHEATNEPKEELVAEAKPASEAAAEEESAKPSPDGADRESASANSDGADEARPTRRRARRARRSDDEPIFIVGYVD